MAQSRQEQEQSRKELSAQGKKKRQKLTPKEKRFVEEYIIDFNATRAAITAGFSKVSARQLAYRLLTKDHIQSSIQKEMQALSERTKITQKMVVDELAMLGFSDIKRYVTWGPSGVEMLHSNDLPDGSSRCIQEVSETVNKDGGSRRFKLHDKVKSLELLGKHLGLFQQSVEVTGSVTVQPANQDLKDELINELKAFIPGMGEKK